MYRKGVCALIINDRKEFLLVNLESFENKYFAIPGGGIEQGETLKDAVYREVREELGIKKGSLQFVGKSQTPIWIKFKAITMKCDGKTYEGSERHFFGFRFIGSNNEICPKDSEVRAYKWVSFAELKHYLLFDNQLKETLRKIAEIFPSVIDVDSYR